MTTNQQRAAEIIWDFRSADDAELTAQELTAAGLLMPDASAIQWLVQIGYRNDAGQTDIVEGVGDTREAAVENAQDQRMLATATEVVRGFAKRYTTPWEAEEPIYTERDKNNDH